MASAGRTLAWAALGICILIAAACASDDAERSSSCVALEALGTELVAYEEFLAWPGITAAPMQQGTDELEAAVLVAANSSDDEFATDIVTAFGTVRAAVVDTIPQSLVDLRPEEPAQMAARFVLVELQPLIDAHARALAELC